MLAANQLVPVCRAMVLWLLEQSLITSAIMQPDGDKSASSCIWELSSVCPALSNVVISFYRVWGRIAVLMSLPAWHADSPPLL